MAEWYEFYMQLHFFYTILSMVSTSASQKWEDFKWKHQLSFHPHTETPYILYKKKSQRKIKPSIWYECLCLIWSLYFEVTKQSWPLIPTFNKRVKMLYLGIWEMAVAFLRLPSIFPPNDDQVNKHIIFLEIDLDSLSVFCRVSKLSFTTERNY